jgi:hypothetical protein
MEGSEPSDHQHKYQHMTQGPAAELENLHAVLSLDMTWNQVASAGH